MCLMALWPVLILRDRLIFPAATGMRCHALSLVEDLYRGQCRSNFDRFASQAVRHAVEVVVEGDVIINVHPCVRPLTHVEWFSRQG